MSEVAVSQVREALDGAELLEWARTCRTDLERRRAEIDALNVFPIADSDTGTNLLATMRAAVAAAEAVVIGGAMADGRARIAGRKEAEGTARLAGAGEADGPGAVVAPRPAAPSAGGVTPTAHVVAKALARGATTGARGNSGIILSQVLRGIAEAVTDGPLTGSRLRTALHRAAVLVRTGLSAPVEGTILTVLDRAAVAAAESVSATLASVAAAAAEGAARALNETPAQLGVLRAAGVVDAGARGLLVLLDCLVGQVCGEAPTRDRYTRATGPTGRIAQPGEGSRAPEAWVADGDGHPSPSPGGLPSPGAHVSSGVARTSGADGARGADLWDEQEQRAEDPHFEVMYVISGTDEAAAGTLRDRLAVLGDSVVVVGDGDSTWSAHVHCRDAGAAIEAGLAAGSLTGIRIESFAVTAPHGGHAVDLVPCDGDRANTAVDARHQDSGGAGRTPDARSVTVPESRVATDGGAAQEARVRSRDGSTPEHQGGAAAGLGSHDRGILAVASGAAAARLFEDAGAVVLRGDRQLDTTALLTAIRAMPNREVLVLPNGALPAQELVAAGVAARDGSRDVLLLPSASMVQGLAALAVHDRGRIAVDDAFAMSEAAATTRWGALRAARVRALTMVGMCSPGDGLGLVGHDVVVIDPDVVGAGRILLDRMLGLGGELVTLLMGADAGPELARVLADHVTAGFPGVEVVVYSGGQQADLVQIGVE
ncbi:DAK2 domain-containing protein [Nocardia asteroides]|uniref:DAK2 domain-containing protein n=1 Tax=Nocardia asteroides TaxID=1824 RepID=UPI00035CEED1